MLLNSANLDIPSAGFPKDRTVLTVKEVAGRWRVSNRHVVDLIEEGKLVAFDIAGRHDFIRMPMGAVHELAKRMNVASAVVIEIIQTTKPQFLGHGRAFYRIPIVEGYNAYMKENHSFNLSGK